MAKSKKPSKQRMEVHSAKLHRRQKLLSAHLSKDLAGKHGRRSVKLRAGDKVKIIRGEFRKKTGKVAVVDRKHLKVQVEGIEKVKKDGTKTMPLIRPSNMIVIELNLEDRKRKKLIERKAKKENVKGKSS